jgi:hypothetical protein
MGVTESQRRTFDYSCVLMRDCSRPLVAQVLWRHHQGIDKDLRTLIQDTDSLLKVYFVKDTIRARTRVDEVLASYRQHPATRDLLRGLRIIPVPSGFDADKDTNRLWMAKYLEHLITRDILFNVVFGRFDSEDFRIFCEHGGPIGLKFAILEIIVREGIWHMPSLKKKLQYGTTGPIREVMTMLNAVGFTRTDTMGVCLSTAKGRVMMDIVRRLSYETQALDSWAPETLLLMNRFHAQPKDIQSYKQIERSTLSTDLLALLLYSAPFSSDFGVETTCTNSDSKFYTENYGGQLQKGISNDFPPVPSVQVSEPEILLFLEVVRPKQTRG